jgi:uncharacterized coiled-coil protein SlyX
LKKETLETEVLVTGYSTSIRRAVLKKLRDKIAELEKRNIPSYQIEDEVERALKWAEERKETRCLAIKVETLEEQNAYQSKALATSTHNTLEARKEVKELTRKLELVTLTTDEITFVEGLLAQVFSLRLRILKKDPFIGDHKKEAGVYRGRTIRALKAKFGLTHGRQTWKEIPHCRFKELCDVIKAGINQLEDELSLPF